MFIETYAASCIQNSRSQLIQSKIVKQGFITCIGCSPYENSFSHSFIDKYPIGKKKQQQQRKLPIANLLNNVIWNGGDFNSTVVK